MNDLEKRAKAMADRLSAERNHDWMKSRVGHGSAQCRNCGCTFEEAKYALGQICPDAKPNPDADLIRDLLALITKDTPK